MLDDCSWPRGVASFFGNCTFWGGTRHSVPGRPRGRRGRFGPRYGGRESEAQTKTRASGICAHEGGEGRDGAAMGHIAAPYPILCAQRMEIRIGYRPSAPSSVVILAPLIRSKAIAFVKLKTVTRLYVTGVKASQEAKANQTRYVPSYKRTRHYPSHRRAARRRMVGRGAAFTLV